MAPIPLLLVETRWSLTMVNINLEIISWALEMLINYYEEIFCCLQELVVPECFLC